MSNRECAYVIGAGFSAGLGYPQLRDLLTGLWGRLEEPLRDDLEKIVRFHHPNFRPNDPSSFPNIEQLMTEMYVNDELFHASRQYEGNFTKQKLQDTLRDLLLAIAAWFHELSIGVNPTKAPPGAVAELVGIEGGVVSGVINLESSGVEASDWRPRHDEPYHEA